MTLDHNIDSRVEQMLASLSQVQHGPPDDFKQFIHDLAPVKQFPSPFASWTLLCLVRYRQRQLWATELIRNCVIEQVDGFRKTLGVNKHLRTYVPDHPELQIDLDGLEEWCTLTHRVTQEVIGVGVGDFEQPVSFIDSDFECYVENLKAGDNHGPETRLKELHASGWSLRNSIMDLRGLKCFKEDDCTMQLNENCLSHVDTISRFCEAWNEGSNRLWLTALIGDWLKAEELAADVSDSVLLEAIQSRSEEVRSDRLEFLYAIADIFPKLNTFRFPAWCGVADLDPSAVIPLARRAFKASVEEATDAFLLIEKFDVNDDNCCPDVFRLLERLTVDRNVERVKFNYSTIACRCGAYLTKRGYRTEKVISFLVAQDTTVIDAVLLSMEHSPDKMWSILEIALRSKKESVFREATAILALIGGPKAEAMCLAVSAESQNAIKIGYCQYALLVMADRGSVPQVLQAVRQHLILCEARCVLPDFDGNPISVYGTARDPLAEQFQGCVDRLADRVLTHRPGKEKVAVS